MAFSNPVLRCSPTAQPSGQPGGCGSSSGYELHCWVPGVWERALQPAGRHGPAGHQCPRTGEWLLVCLRPPTHCLHSHTTGLPRSAHRVPQSQVQEHTAENTPDTVSVLGKWALQLEPQMSLKRFYTVPLLRACRAEIEKGFSKNLSSEDSM